MTAVAIVVDPVGNLDEPRSGGAVATSQVNDVLFDFMDAAEFRQFRAMVDRMTECGDRAVDLLDYLGESYSVPRQPATLFVLRPPTAQREGKVAGDDHDAGVAESASCPPVRGAGQE